MRLTWVLILLLLAVPAYAFEEFDEVVINSKDWTDIYSGMMFASFNHKPGSYLIEESRGYLLMETIGQSGKQILLFESPEQNYIKNYGTDLESNRLSVENINDYDDLNLELAAELDMDSFIILDESYSYNAVSVAPYAILKERYVIFADNENIDSVVEFLDTGTPDLIIYGLVDREVTDALARFNPETINLGNKYENNLEIVKRFYDEKSFSQYLLTNGAFLEPQFFSAASPILFIGNTNIPDSTLEFLQESDVKHAILIGNELFDLGTQLKENADMKIMIKFAKGINKVQYSLDTLTLPAFIFIPVFESFVYNPATKQLIVTISNRGSSPMFARTTYNILENNETIATVGDEEPFFIGETSSTTRTYDLDLSTSQGVIVDAIMSYGEEVGSLDFLMVDRKEIVLVEFDDQSKIEIIDAVYDSQIKRFIIQIRNTGEEKVHVLPIITDIIINNKITNLAGEKTVIKPGKTAAIKIKARLSPEDIEDNEEYTLIVEYGAEENLLVKRLIQTMEFRLKSYIVLYVVSAVLLIILILILLLFKRKPKKHHIHAVPKPHSTHTHHH